LPNEPSEEQRRILDELNGLAGDEFDQRWVSTQMTAHQQAIQATETQVAQGTDPGVKRVAEDALPVLREHHQALMDLARQMGVQVPPGATATPTPGTPTPGTPTPGTPTPGTPTPGEPGTPEPGTPTPGQPTPEQEQTPPAVPAPNGS
ncbi:MAG TPA: DUF4142 domain-containing protein, partial [Micromonosporaceae bacterium]